MSLDWKLHRYFVLSHRLGGLINHDVQSIRFREY